jgi:putative hydrolase of the HAD superfamily
MIQAITFDLWNTIFQNKSYSEVRIKFLKDFLKLRGNKINIATLKNCFERVFLPYSNEFSKEIDRHIYNDVRLEKVVECLKINLSSSERERILLAIESEMLCDPPLLKPGVPDTLKELGQKYKIGLISNTGITPGRIIKKVLKDYDILKYFQVTIFSDEIGYYKPNKILFQAALKQLRSEPEKSIHVGDLLHTDIKGAKDYGMLNIWFNDLNQPSDSVIIPDFEVKSMRNIINIITKLK